MKDIQSRRGFLKGGLSLGGIALSLPALGQVVGTQCGPTPAQTEGPFYPVDLQLDEDNDLVQVRGKTGKAEGDMIYVRGRVLDESCNPLGGALVEIWQANKHGRYDHPNDPNSSVPFDSNFQYWGRSVTNAEGEYLFRTILPGSYPAAPGWVRPPHIHYKVQKRGFFELTTQLYFEGQSLNDKDKILLSLSKADQKKVVVPLVPATTGFDPNSQIATFDVVLTKV